MITIFTPVYNRAYIIERLYQSLLKQTSFHFEWLIVDDGSTDNIAELVAYWQSKTDLFPIRFFQQQNGGKHRAINRGVREAAGEAFFIVDSDDYLTNNAIQLVESWWNQIDKNENLAGVSGLRGNGHVNAIVGDKPLFHGYVDATNLERAKLGLSGDKAEVYKTKLLKAYPFPEFIGENFITENVVWDKIAYDGYKLRWHDQVTYICEYREDGLTYQGRELYYKNPKGWGLFIKQNRVFGRTDDKTDYLAKLNYFEMMHTKLAETELIKNLGIDAGELHRIKGYINRTITMIGKNIAIYGLGKRGKRLLRLYCETPIKIEYVLDKAKVNEGYTQFELDDDLPEVDAIIVTPRYEQEEIIASLRLKTRNRLLRYEEWELMIILREEIEKNSF